jgi:hypothetical protein
MATKKKATTAVVKISREKTRELETYGMTGRARVSAQFVEEVIKERDEALTKLKDAQQAETMWRGRALEALNYVEQFKEMLTMDQVKTSALIRLCLAADKMIEFHNRSRNGVAKS